MEAFDDIRVRDLVFFDRLAALGSITAAAKDMGIPKPTASRWLARLEECVGHPLVKRTTRRIAMTEQGEAFGRRVRNILSVVNEARFAAHEQVPGGTLRVSVPVPMGRMLAGPVITEFRKRLPMVRLEIKLQNDRVDLIRDGIDLAIRGGELPDSEWIAKKLSVAPMWLYVSAGLRNEVPSRIPVIAAPGDEALLRRSRIGMALGKPSVLVDDRTVVADALAWGGGAGLLPSFLGEAHRSEGALERLDPAPVAAVPVHAIYHPSQREDPRLRIIIDTIAKQLNEML